jgi:hypothetical protein
MLNGINVPHPGGLFLAHEHGRAAPAAEAFFRVHLFGRIAAEANFSIQVYLGKRPADFGTGFRPNGND